MLIFEFVKLDFPQYSNPQLEFNYATPVDIGTGAQCERSLPCPGKCGASVEREATHTRLVMRFTLSAGKGT